MAHELEIAADGTASMAYVDTMAVPWHGLGQKLTPNSPIEVWLEQARMNWDIKRANVQFSTGEDTKMFPAKHVLYRNDTHAPLSVVSPTYKIVQPKDVLEFYRELTELHGMKLKTAGVLFGGKKFWAMAEIGEMSHIIGDTYMNNNLLLTTSCDGSAATTSRLTSVDVVCNNTLSVAVGGGARIVRIAHNSQWNPKAVKIEMGVIDTAWDKFIVDIKRLATTPVSDREAAADFLINLFDPRHADESWINLAEEEKMEAASMGTTDVCGRVYDLYNGAGKGATQVGRDGTWFGLLSAVTEYTEYHTKHQTTDARINASWFGTGNDLKDRALSLALEMAV